jgi:hypothetical protein
MYGCHKMISPYLLPYYGTHVLAGHIYGDEWSKATLENIVIV